MLDLNYASNQMDQEHFLTILLTTEVEKEHIKSGNNRRKKPQGRRLNEVEIRKTIGQRKQELGFQKDKKHIEKPM